MTDTTEYRKMTFIPYDSVKFETEKTDQHFVAMYNPTTFVRKNAIEYDDGQSGGTSKAEPKFVVIKPSDLSVELFLDGTGTSPSFINNKKEQNGERAASDKSVDVQTQVDNFTKTCAEYYGNQHGPNYVKILWGKQLFKGVLTSMDVTFTLFDRHGVPLRAKIAATFLECISDTHRVKEDKNSSPDLTHVRTVLEGDTLPLMAHKIYGDPKYYLQVAQANGLKNYRKLRPGQTLYFPPIDKA